jgi:hypothetical protein
MRNEAEGVANKWSAFVRVDISKQQRQLFLKRKEVAPVINDEGRYFSGRSYVSKIEMSDLTSYSGIELEPCMVGYLDWDKSGDEVLDFIQAIVNLGADLGIVPKGEELANELKATKYHLEDLREIQGLKRNDKKS